VGLSRNDPDALAEFSPETKYGALLGNVSQDSGWHFKPREAADSLGPSSGFYVVKQKLMPENQADSRCLFRRRS